MNLRVFFTGICMGAADLIPGISGGTIAFIMGIYEELITSIRSLQRKRLPFLFSLLFGMAFSFLFFSHGIHRCLNDAHLRPLLYASFMGLIAASIVFLVRQIKHWRISDIAALFLGAVVAFFLSGQQLSNVPHAHLSSSYVHPWLMFSGALAISAMLLPGISGSYILIIFGVYPVALEALTDFSSGLKQGIIDFPAFILLSNIFVGIVCGAIIFSRAIGWLLKNHHQLTIALLIGFMIGAIRTAWPFWDYTYIAHPFKPEKGTILFLTNPILPDFHSLLFWQAFGFACVGFGVVFLLDYFSSSVRQKA